MKKQLFFLGVAFLTLQLKAQSLDFLNSGYDAETVLKSRIDFNDTTTYENKMLVMAYEYAINHNSSVAWRTLGKVFEKGLGIIEDKVIALQCYKKAAWLGDALSQYRLAKMYKDGRKLPQDFHHAFLLAQASASGGYSSGMALTAYLYFKGFGIEQNYVKAFEYAEQSAEQEHVYGKHLMAYCYEKGTGVERNIAKAKYIYEELAQLGFKQSIVRLERINASSHNVIKSLSFNDAPAIWPDVIVKDINTHKPLQARKLKLPPSIAGEWKGQIVIYDWSGKHIEEKYPLNLQMNQTGLKISGSWQWGNKKACGFTGKLEGSIINFNKLIMALPGAAGDDDNWIIKQGNLACVENDTALFMSGDLRLFCASLNEPFRPVNIVLYKTYLKSGDYLSPIRDNHASEEVLNELTIYPNPVEKVLNITYYLLDNYQVSIGINSLTGQTIKIIDTNIMQQAGYNHYPIDVSMLVPGVYLLHVKVGNQSVVNKFVKQ